MKIQIQINLEYAVIFLTDPYQEDTIPDDLGAQTISSSDNCVAIQVPPYFEGGATVVLSSERPEGEQEPVFETHLPVSTGALSLSDSARFNYCMVPIAGEQAHVKVWIDCPKPGEIWIMVEPILEY